MYDPRIQLISGIPGRSQFEAALASGDDGFDTRPALGSVMKFNDGSQFVYCCTKADLALSQMVAHGTAMAITDNICTAAAIGATEVTIDITGVTVWGTAASIDKDELVGGYLMVTDGAGAGYSYLIKGNTADDSDDQTTLTLWEPIQVALTTASDICIISSPFSRVQVATASLAPIGRACVATTAATDSETQYFWVQTYGLCVPLGTGTVGQSLACGAAGVVEVGAAVTDVIVGFCTATSVDTYCPAYLTCLNFR